MQLRNTRGPQVEPPRDRWFLPTVRRDGQHLVGLSRPAAAPANISSTFSRIPATRFSFWVASKMLSDPSTPWRQHLCTSIEDLYGTSSRSVTEALAGVFIRAEDAYLRYALATQRYHFHQTADRRSRGPLVYLMKQLTAAQRVQYRGDPQSIVSRLSRLAPEIPATARVRKISSCLDHVIHVLQSL